MENLVWKQLDLGWRSLQRFGSYRGKEGEGVLGKIDLGYSGVTNWGRGRMPRPLPCCPAAPPPLPSFPQPFTEAEALLLRPCAMPGPAHHWAGHAACRRAQGVVGRRNRRPIPCSTQAPQLKAVTLRFSHQVLQAGLPAGGCMQLPQYVPELHTQNRACATQQGHRHLVLDTQPLRQLCTRGHTCPIEASLSTCWMHS